MEFIGVVFIYHILYYFGLFILTNDCFIVVALKTIVNTADNGYQGYKKCENWSHLLLSTQGGCVCPYTVTDCYIRCGRGSRKQVTYCINSLIYQTMFAPANLLI